MRRNRIARFRSQRSGCAGLLVVSPETPLVWQRKAEVDAGGWPGVVCPVEGARGELHIELVEGAASENGVTVGPGWKKATSFDRDVWAGPSWFRCWVCGLHLESNTGLDLYEEFRPYRRPPRP